MIYFLFLVNKEIDKYKALRLMIKHLQVFKIIALKSHAKS